VVVDKRVVDGRLITVMREVILQEGCGGRFGGARLSDGDGTEASSEEKGDNEAEPDVACGLPGEKRACDQRDAHGQIMPQDTGLVGK